MANVTFDPTVPAGTESLKRGPSRIEAIAANLLKLFGYGGTASANFNSPIAGVKYPVGNAELLLAHDPTDSMSAATKGYVDKRVALVTLKPNDLTTTLYVDTDTASPYPGSTFDSGVIYVFVPTDTNTGTSVQIALTNVGVSFPIYLKRINGDDFAAGDFVAAEPILALYDAASNYFRAIEPYTLSPPLKQYVDQGVRAPVFRRITALASPSPITVGTSATGTPIIQVPAITIPTNDTTSYLASYLIHVEIAAHFQVDFLDDAYVAALWIQDDTTPTPWTWAHGMMSLEAIHKVRNMLVTASGFSPVLYSAGATVNLTLRAYSNASVAVPGNTRVYSDFYGTLPLPGTYVTYTLVRATM